MIQYKQAEWQGKQHRARREFESVLRSRRLGHSGHSPFITVPRGYDIHFNPMVSGGYYMTKADEGWLYQSGLFLRRIFLLAKPKAVTVECTFSDTSTKEKA